MTEPLPATISLEQLADARFGRRLHSGRTPLPFAPQATLRPRAYDDIPCVMIVATEATRELHQGLLEAVELMQSASSAFKVAVFTDTAGAGGFRSFGWAVEHCFSEVAWAELSEKDWLAMALQRLVWAQKTYGASYVMAAQSVQDAVDLLEHLGSTFEVSPAVVTAACGHLRDTIHPGSPQIHRTLRGWLDGVDTGHSLHEVSLRRGETIQIEIHRDGRDLLVAAPTSRSDEVLLDEARSDGWSTVAIDCDGLTGGPARTLDVISAVASGLTRSTSEEVGVCVVALFSTEVHAAGTPDASVFDASVEKLDSGQYLLRTSYGREMRFAPAGSQRALATVRNVQRLAAVL